MEQNLSTTRNHSLEKNKGKAIKTWSAIIFVDMVVSRIGLRQSLDTKEWIVLNAYSFSNWYGASRNLCIELLKLVHDQLLLFFVIFGYSWISYFHNESCEFYCSFTKYISYSVHVQSNYAASNNYAGESLKLCCEKLKNWEQCEVSEHLLVSCTYIMYLLLLPQNLTNMSPFHSKLCILKHIHCMLLEYFLCFQQTIHINLIRIIFSFWPGCLQVLNHFSINSFFMQNNHRGYWFSFM